MAEQRRPPLDGVTVLEAGVFMAAPFATMQLADLGARVLKIENPDGGDPTRETGPFVAGESSPFLRLNRNKESVALNLKSPAGKEAFLRLAGGSDVVVENLRPGAMRRLGLDYENVSRANPAIVYASASGWGQDGPLAGQAGLDIMAQARSGLMSITGEPDGDPAKVGVPVCDLVCGLYTALAVVAALHERRTGERGQYIDVSLLESAVSLSVWEAGRYFATGQAGGRYGSAHQAHAPYQALRTADGHVTVGATTARTWRALCAVLDLGGLAGDERYTTAFTRREHRDTLIPAIEAVTRRRSSAELLDALSEAGVPCAPISEYGEVYTDTHLHARDYFWDAEHPAAGAIRQLGSPMRFSDTPARRGTAGPVLGAATRAALRGAGVGEDEIAALLAGGAGRPEENTSGP
ncbi:CoA transferase [Streptomonospora sediminis]